MSREFDLIVFDWDGTLMDSVGHIVGAMQAAIEEHGVEPRSEQQIRDIIGLGMAEALATLYPDEHITRRNAISASYGQHYVTGPYQSAPFAGVTELLQELSRAGYLLAVATGKSRRGLERVFEAFDLRSHFVATRCADEASSKPHPQMLLELMDLFAVDPSRALMVGDSEFDLQMANNAGVRAVGVTSGSHSAEYLWTFAPVAVLDNAVDLPRWLRNSK